MATQLSGPVMPIKTVSDNSCTASHYVIKCDQHYFIVVLYLVNMLINSHILKLLAIMASVMMVKRLNIIHCSSQVMTNLRNLCISLMKHLNPLSDDCYFYNKLEA